jgi:hypothetical protein
VRDGVIENYAIGGAVAAIFLHLFLESDIIDNAQLFEILQRHVLSEKWEAHFGEKLL